MPVYNLIEYTDNYSITSGSLWQYYRDESFLDANGVVADFPAANNSSPLFLFKQKITDKTVAGGREDVEIMVPLRYLSNFWRTLGISLINCEINLILTWSSKCVLSNDAKTTTFAITDTKLFVPVVTLSTQDNAKILKN